MRLAHRVVRITSLGIVSLAFATSAALAAHVAPVLPLTAMSNHSHEKFTPTVFPAADLSSINFAFADLTNCTFSPGTNLAGANFTGAKLQNASLAGCVIDNANFLGADLSFAVLPCGDNTSFRGAILTGATAPSPCSNCLFGSPNLKDACTVGDVPTLCLTSVPFRGVVAGVVFDDLNSNGTLDFGEPGIPGVPVTVTDQLGSQFLVTDSRGAYAHVSTAAAPASSQVGPLPVGRILAGPTSFNVNLAGCRTGHGLNYPTVDLATPATRSSFGQLKLIYR